MGRKRKPFERPEGKLKSRLIVIATEGQETERIYFESVAKEHDKPSLHVEIIKDVHDPDPESVFEQLLNFSEIYELEDDDELWMVIDRDYQSWTEANISKIAQLCHQKRGFNLALSNPCFEIWLIMHFEDVTSLNNDVKEKLFKNRKRGNKTYTKRYLSNLNGGFNPSKYDPTPFLTKIDTAINNGKNAESNPNARWPNNLGSRVYRLVSKIIKK